MGETLAVDVVVDAPPDEVVARLKSGLLPMRSLWLPTPRELRAWDASSEAMWVRWVGERRFIAGPRVFSPGAARFCPVVGGRIEPCGRGQSRLMAARQLPRGAMVLVGIWAALLVAWAAVQIPALLAEGDVRWLPWWGMIAASLAAAVVAGLSQGGRALDHALPHLERVAADPGAGEDDW